LKLEGQLARAFRNRFRDDGGMNVNETAILKKGGTLRNFCVDRASAITSNLSVCDVPCDVAGSRSPLHRFFRIACSVYVHTPIITGKRLRRRGEFVPSFNHRRQESALKTARSITGGIFSPANLSSPFSGQLEAEAFACALYQGLYLRPTFRAENSNTSRHASEFWMIEPEMAFCDLTGNMDLAENW